MPKNDDLGWLIAPLIGVASIIGLAFMSSNKSNNLPPPPAPTKEGDCGCNAANNKET